MSASSRGNAAHQKGRVAIDLAVATLAGIVPGYDRAAGWWRVNDLAFYAFQAATIMIRIGAESTDTPVASICAEIAATHRVEL